MRRIVLARMDTMTILLDDVDERTPIFAKKEGELRGMIVKENDRWILKLGGSRGATGWHTTLRECLESCLIHGYEFLIN